MRFSVRRDAGRYVAMLEFDSVDMAKATLDPMDQALLRECELSGSISDKVLALETITRRIEEKYAKEASREK